MNYFTKIEPDDKLTWNKCLTNFSHHIGHTQEYIKVFHNDKTTFALYYEKNNYKTFLIFSERTFNNTIDIYTPYGSGWILGDIDDTFINDFYQWAKEQNYICAYLSVNPFQNKPILNNEDSIHIENEMFLLDLSPSISEIHHNFSSNLIKKLNLTYKTEFQLIDKDEINIEEFFQLYTKTLNRVNARGIYYYSFHQISNLFSLENSLIIGVTINNKLIATSIFLYTQDYAEYFINAAEPEGQMYTVYLINEAIKYLKKHNVCFLNLGGGVKPQDGLWQFKKRFGGEHHTLSALKLILNFDVFSHMVGNNSKNNSFFPPYYKK